MPRPSTRRSPRHRAKGLQRRGRKMASPADAKLPSSSGKENAEGANVDKIRDILFGSQMRDYEKRFMRLEDTVTKPLDTLRDYVKEETDSLGQRIKSEKSERAESVKEITREIKDGAKIVEKKL